MSKDTNPQLPQGIASLLDGFEMPSTAEPDNTPDSVVDEETGDDTDEDAGTNTPPPVEDRKPAKPEGRQPVTPPAAVAEHESEEDEAGTIRQIVNSLEYSPEALEELGEIPDAEDLPAFTTFLSDKLLPFERKMAVQDYFERIQEQFPDAFDYFMHRFNGGKPEEFMESQATLQSSAALDPTNDAHQKRIVTRALKEEGYTEEEISEELTRLEDTGGMERKAIAAHRKQKAADEAAYNKKLAEQEAANQQRIENAKRSQEQVKQAVITTGKLQMPSGTIEIPANKRTEFYSWLMEVDKDGKTGRSKALESLPLESQLALNYLLFTGLDLPSLAARIKTTKAIEQNPRGEGKRMFDGGKTARKQASDTPVYKQEDLPELLRK